MSLNQLTARRGASVHVPDSMFEMEAVHMRPCPSARGLKGTIRYTRGSLHGLIAYVLTPDNRETPILARHLILS